MCSLPIHPLVARISEHSVACYVAREIAVAEERGCCNLIVWWVLLSSVAVAGNFFCPSSMSEERGGERSENIPFLKNGTVDVSRWIHMVHIFMTYDSLPPSP